MVLLPGCSCCGCSEDCCRTKTYSYMDTEPKGKWYDECPEVGQCGGAAGSCANAVLEGFIIERFCKQSVEGKLIKAKLRKNSAIDDFGSVAGVDTDVYCGRLGVITADHDITSALVIEDDPDDSTYSRVKVPFRAVNANHGGPYGLSAVTICWCCITEGDPPCDCCKTEPPPPPPKKYACVDGECVETANGKYDEPTCGGQCGDDFVGACCTDYGLSYVSRAKCRGWGGTFYEPGEVFDQNCGCDCIGVGGDFVTDPACVTIVDHPDPCFGPFQYCAKTEGYQVAFSGGYISIPGGTAARDELIEKNAQAILWIDQGSASAGKPGDQESTRCCIITSTTNRERRRIFVLNCRTKSWEQLLTISDTSVVTGTGSTDGVSGPDCLGQLILASEDPVPPSATLAASSPTCIPPPPNPLP